MLTFSPSLACKARKDSDDTIVSTPSVMKAWCKALVTATRSVCGTSPSYQAVMSEPKARPKLIDNCWNELDSVLAWLESASAMSA